MWTGEMTFVPVKGGALTLLHGVVLRSFGTSFLGRGRGRGRIVNSNPTPSSAVLACTSQCPSSTIILGSFLGPFSQDEQSLGPDDLLIACGPLSVFPLDGRRTDSKRIEIAESCT